MSSKEKKALQEIKQGIKELVGDALVGVWLYGSKARGDYDSSSDTDVAVIVRGLTREKKNDILNKVAEVECKYLTPVFLLVLFEDEYEYLKKRERKIALDIEKEGIAV